MPFGRYRITHPTVVVLRVAGRDAAGLVPGGAIIEVSSEAFDGDEPVEVLWDRQPVKIFPRDLRSRTVWVEEGTSWTPDPSPREEERILRILRDNYKTAREHAQNASETFNRTVIAPTGLPHPDAQQQVRNVSREFSAARRALMEAIQRLNAFVIHRTVPEDLKKGLHHDTDDQRNHCKAKAALFEMFLENANAYASAASAASEREYRIAIVAFEQHCKEHGC